MGGPTTITYRDVSHYDYDAGTRDLSGEPLVIAKATEGTGFHDPAYAYWRDHCHGKGIPFGAYHWINTADLGKQAANAFGVVGVGVPLMVDAEADGATVSRILELVKRYRALGGLCTLVYLPRWWWSGHIGSPDLRPLEAAGLALVSSDYNNTPPTGWDPYGGMTPQIWQYTSTPHDRNRYQGTVDELLSLVFARTHAPQEVDMLVLFDMTAEQSPTGAAGKFASGGPGSGYHWVRTQAELDMHINYAQTYKLEIKEEPAPVPRATAEGWFGPFHPWESASPTPPAGSVDLTPVTEQLEQINAALRAPRTTTTN